MSIPSEIAIRVNNLSKVYPRHMHSFSLRQEGSQVIKSWVQRFQAGRSPQNTPTDFKALDNVSFTVRRGESLGIVGRNGSGKTTLIRLMANIMRPSTGTVQVDGRFAALIGLGTGFIPEMTGRKNIYLNAAIYGVPPDETNTFIAEIIDFAELDDFIDEPVKTYSSGMRARLGFSVAIHILPEIIFVDEALAVGDAGFQKKCNERINQLLAENRTFVLVSHGNDIAQLCDRVIWLDKGKIVMDGDSQTVLKAYQDYINGEN